MDLEGLLSHRQVEQQQAQPVVEPPPPPQEQPKPEPKVVEKPKPKPKPKPKEVEKPKPKPEALVRKEEPPSREPEAPAPVAAPPRPVPVVARNSGQEQRVQESLRRKADDALRDLFNRYLQGLKLKLQRNLVYPDTAKLSGLQGITVIGFTVTNEGGIREDSLRVIKSSGFPELDRNALMTARLSAPFNRPPREIRVAVAVAFEVEI